MADTELKQYMEEVGPANATPGGFELWKKEKEPKELAIWENGCPEWVIAYDEKDANKIISKHYGIDYDAHDDEDWTKLDPDKEFTFCLNEMAPQELYDILEKERFPRVDILAVAKVKDWIDAMGHGFLATTEY